MTTPTATHAAALCHRRCPEGDLEILVIRTSDGRRWTLPKGGREPGEELSHTALRETAEESGWSGEIDPRRLTAFHYLKPSRTRQDTVAVYLLAATAYTDIHEAREQRWLPPDEAVTLLAEDRDPYHAAELARVVQQATAALEANRG